MSVEHISKTRSSEHQRSTLPARHLAGVLLALTGIEDCRRVTRGMARLGQAVELGEVIMDGALAGWHTTARVETETIRSYGHEGELAVRTFAQRHDRRVTLSIDRVSGWQDDASKVAAVEADLAAVAQAMDYNYRPVVEGMTDFPPLVAEVPAVAHRHVA